MDTITQHMKSQTKSIITLIYSEIYNFSIRTEYFFTEVINISKETT